MMLIVQTLCEIIFRLMLLAVIFWIGACLIAWGIDSLMAWFIHYYRHKANEERKKEK